MRTSVNGVDFEKFVCENMSTCISLREHCLGVNSTMTKCILTNITFSPHDTCKSDKVKNNDLNEVENATDVKTLTNETPTILASFNEESTDPSFSTSRTEIPADETMSTIENLEKSAIMTTLKDQKEDRPIGTLSILSENFYETDSTDDRPGPNERTNKAGTTTSEENSKVESIVDEISISENAVNSTSENPSSETISTIENPEETKNWEGLEENIKMTSSMMPQTESADKSISTNKTPQRIKTVEDNTPSSSSIIMCNFHSTLFIIANVISFFQYYI